MGKLDAAAEILTTNPVDLSLLEAMARDYHKSLRQRAADISVSEAMLALANNHMRSICGNTILFFSGAYLLTPEGVIDDDAHVLASVRGVRTTFFFEQPFDIGEGRQWQTDGLGLVLEPHDELIDRVDLVDAPIQKLAGLANLYTEVIMPINGNMVMAANPMIGSPTDS